ncbi:hypothetical protein C0Q70_10987 [Pomacea canaliculata]|uniref:Mon2/Sec7/BIG1-like HDS domain-containing protein n=1 Tax=Pomacea canaliculata TaxID=400727 RepID=A0A2T7P4R1_POMCA|nr:hypothetical protein C0Q70_10987 [Pomacea canaliculata]
MEDTLQQLGKEIVTPKFGAIKNCCNSALAILQNEEALQTTEAWKLREICLEPLQLALESRAKKLAYHALTGIQLLLNMTLTTAWCMNARIVTKISQLYLSCHAASPRSFAGQMAATCLKESLAEWYGCQTCQIHRSDTMKILMARLESCKDGPAQGQREDCSDGSDMNKNGEGSVSQVDDGDDVLADFKSTAPAGSMESIMEEVVALLHFLLDKMDGTQSSTPGKHVLLLLLEGVHAILNKVPTVIQHNALFQELVWKHLCPTLISLLGTPKMEKSASAQRTAQSKEEMGRGSGCSTSAPNIMASAAKVIYSIASELVRLVGTVGSLRPVLESLFHRMLLYPPPQHRLDALRIVKEMLGNPERLLDLCAPAAEAGLVKMAIADVGLIKLILDAVQECCHCNDSAICFTSVTCVDSLLQSLECLAHGQAISDTLLVEIKHACTDLQKGSLGNGNDLDIYGGSMREVLQNPYVSKDPSVSDSPPDSPRPVADSDGNSEASSMDMPTMKRVTVLRMCDVEGAEVQAEHAAAPLENADLECAGAGNATPQTDNTEKVLLSEKDALDLKELQNGATDAASDWVKPEEDECENAGKWSNKVDVNTAVKHQQQLDDQDVIRQKYKILRERLEGMEQQNAAQFVQQLHGITADLVTMLSITDVDEALQTFSSNFCANLSKQQSTEVHAFASGEASPSVVLNADGVYTASVAALQLCYKLSQRGFYKDKESHHISVTQRQFVDGVLSSGLLLFLSPTWLTEVYKQVLESPLMEVTNLTTMDTPLLQFLEDLDGLGSHEIGGQFLFEYRSELYSHSSGMTSSEPQEKVDAGKLVAQCILRTCWDGLLDVLSVLLNGKSSCGISFSLGLLLGMEGAKEETQRARDAICLSLNGLQTASRLSCVLGLQSKCGSAFSQLASTSCVREDLRATAAGPVDGKGSLKAAVLREKPRLVRLHAANVLSMDVVMTTGLEVGSHASDCWRHVFRCCAHISELEHTYFSHGNHQSSLPKVQQEQAPDAESAGDTTIPDAETVEGPFMTAAAVPVAPRINVAELIRQSSLESGWETSLLGGGVLTPAQAAKALCGLSQEVDILFEDAASKLNLQALLSFLTELGEASRQQLQSLQSHTDAGDPSDILPVVTQSSQHCQGPHLPTNALHLYRLQEVLLAVVHSPRPLLHLMQVWAAISPYLVEATGHRDRSVSKMAVTCIHDFIVAMLTGHPEHPHFHVNEFLCKTFEDMLCLELCDSDVQDQIVCSICELVEACTKELQSGWRPLFGALRSVRIEITANEEVNEARQRHVAAVLDVFEVYLNTDNLLVFANATVDCILCLLKYVNGPGMFEDEDGEDSSDSGSDMGTTGVSSENLCLPALTI